MFSENKKHLQRGLFSFMGSIPDRVRRIVKGGWSELFYKHIFSKINEKLFSVLYSEKYSRPNIPVNILVGLEIIKWRFNYTDEELFEAYYTDLRVMHALGLSFPGEIDFGIRTLYRFRGRVVKYEQETGICLMKRVFLDLASSIARVFGIDLSVQRMDSSFLDANIKNLSRLNLFVKVLYNFLSILDPGDLEQLPDDLQYFAELSNLDVAYKLRREDVGSKLELVSRHLYWLYLRYKNNPDYNETRRFKELERLLVEQTNLDDIDFSDESIELKEPTEIDSGSLQNPSDGDASYRNKGGEKHKGYAINASESCGEDNEFQLITDIQIDKNNVPDSKLLDDSLDDTDSLVSEADNLYVDAGYTGENTEKKCKDNGIELHISGIKGRKVKVDSIGLEKWLITEDRAVCPAGKRAILVKYNNDNKRYYIRMNKDDCSNCRLREKCLVKKRRKFYSFGFYKRALLVSRRRERLRDKDYRKRLNVRAGAEGMIYQIFYKIGNTARYRGLLRVKNAIILRNIAVNLQRMVKYVRNNPEDKPVFLFFSKICGYMAFLLVFLTNLRFNKVKSVAVS